MSSKSLLAASAVLLAAGLAWPSASFAATAHRHVPVEYTVLVQDCVPLRDRWCRVLPPTYGDTDEGPGFQLHWEPPLSDQIFQGVH